MREMLATGKIVLWRMQMMVFGVIYLALERIGLCVKKQYKLILQVAFLNFKNLRDTSGQNYKVLVPVFNSP